MAAVIPMYDILGQYTTRTDCFSKRKRNTSNVAASSCMDSSTGWSELDKPSLGGLLAELKRCSRSRDLKKGIQLHSLVSTSDYSSNRFVVNSLINMYAKCGSMSDARNVFDSTSAHERDVVAWTALMQGYVENGESEIALKLFHDMEENAGGCVPDARTYLAALSACANMATKEKQLQGKVDRKWLETGRAIHSRAVKNRCCDAFVETRLVDMYAKCGSMKDARSVFDEIADKQNKMAWTALLQGYVENGKSEMALELFHIMEDTGNGFVPDARTYVVLILACVSLAAGLRDTGRISDCKRWLVQGEAIHTKAVNTGCSNIFVENTMLDLYSKCGRMSLARSLFERMPRRDLVSWNVLITGYVENGESEMALEMVAGMDSARVVKDSRTYVAALLACGNLMALEAGVAFHGELRTRNMDREVMVANSLIDFYGKCGRLEDARQVFNSIARKTVVSWTALMSVYGQQGDTEHVFELFETMRERGVQPNEVTFVCLLTACSHAGLTDKGKEYFDSMAPLYGISPSIKHYNCLVDILGRANQLEEAMRVVKSMPFEANAVTWRVIVGACRKWKNVTLGKVAYECLLKLDKKDSAGYLLMANMSEEFALSGGSRLLHGYSKWIDEAGQIHRFETEQQTL